MRAVSSSDSSAKASWASAAAGARAPDVMLSFRHRDALAATLTALGRRVVSARRVQGLEARLHGLGARLLLIDARDAPFDALTAVETLAAGFVRGGGRTLVLLDDADAELAPTFIALGADQLLGAPWRDWELSTALALADRHNAARQPALSAAAPIGWQADMVRGTLAFDEGGGAAALADRFDGTSSMRVALRRLAPVTRSAAFRALRRLRSGEQQVVLIDSDAAGTRWVHHVVARATMLVGWVEQLGGTAVTPSLPIDPVSGLPWLDENAPLADRGGQGALVLVEIGRMARINDHGGRSAGDALIASVAKALHRGLREGAVADAQLFRLSGARLAVLSTGASSPARLAAEVRALLAVHNELPAGLAPELAPQYRVAATKISGPGDMADVLAAAARRLSAARAVVGAVDIEALLSGSGLTVLLQPQYALPDDRLIGAEALVRWPHPRLGEVGGALLFAAAASTGNERALSLAIWRQVLTEAGKWPKELHGLRIALNATATDITDPLMPSTLLEMAREHGVAPQRLTIEVTEAAVMDNLDDAAATLRRLRAAGLKVALDDFGSGYSSLSWLKRLPADYIKIDASFARDIAGASRDRLLLTGIIGLARTLGLATLVEGVETAEQRDALTAAGCSAYQGFLKSPALRIEEFAALALGEG